MTSTHDPIQYYGNPISSTQSLKTPYSPPNVHAQPPFSAMLHEKEHDTNSYVSYQFEPPTTKDNK